MYLTAHRVLCRTGGSSGVNAFWYTHQNSPLPKPLTPTAPEENPGHLFRYRTDVSPVGNRIISFLDIVCPDEFPPAEVEGAFRTFVQQHRRTRLPWSGTLGQCIFRFNLDAQIAAVWLEEIEELFEAALLVRTGTRPQADVEEAAQAHSGEGQITRG